MLQKLRELAGNMVISDQFLDVEEEALFFRKVQEWDIDVDMGEAILQEILLEFKALRETALQEEAASQLESLTKETVLLSLEAEKRLQSFFLSKTSHLSLPRVKQVIKTLCMQQDIAIESAVKEQLLDYALVHELFREKKEAREKALQKWLAESLGLPSSEATRLIEELSFEEGWQ